MCDKYQTITQVVLSPDDKDDPRVAKFWADAGALSMAYADLQKTTNNIFPASADEESLRKHLRARLLPDREQPQQSSGQIAWTGATPGLAVGTTLQVKRLSDGLIFQCIQPGTVAGDGSLALYFQAIDTGNVTNLESLGQPFQVITPIAGLPPACTNSTKFLNGRDLETPPEMLARIQAHDQDENSGGNAAAYEAWAHAASPEVVTAKAIKLARGSDTVDVVITSGTTDIAGAIALNQPVVRTPSAPLIAAVQAYIAAQNPITDDVLVKAPTEVAFNSTVLFSLYNESPANRTYVNGIITNLWKVFVYEAQSLDVLTPTALERIVDANIGSLLSGRQVGPFGSGGATAVQVPSGQLFVPGTLTLGTLA